MALVRRLGGRRLAFPALFLAVAAAVVAAGLVQPAPPAAVPAAAPVLVGPPLAPPDQAPAVKAPAAILVDADSGQILYEKNAHARRPPASITKLMTLELLMEALRAGRVHLDDAVVVSGHAEGYGGAEMFLAQGERMRLEDLLYGIAMFSANDASVAVAEHLAGSEQAFVAEMNRRARELGMRDSHFENPHGLPGYRNHYTSAYDVALLSRYLVTHFPEVLKYTGTWEHWVRKGTKAELWMTNFNRGLVEYPGMDGLKTGFTEESGFNLSATAQRDGRRLIAVVLGAPTAKERNAEVYRLLDYGFGAFDTVKVARPDRPVGAVRVYEGVGRQVELVPAEPVAVTVPRGSQAQVSSRVLAPPAVVAPVRKGQELGTLVVARGEKEVERVPLVAAAGVAKANPLVLAGRYWRSLWLPPAR